MDVTLYIDTYPGMEPEHVYANRHPGKKPANATRYRIDFELPDPNEPDVVIESKDVQVTKVE